MGVEKFTNFQNQHQLIVKYFQIQREQWLQAKLYEFQITKEEVYDHKYAMFRDKLNRFLYQSTGITKAEEYSVETELAVIKNQALKSYRTQKLQDALLELNYVVESRSMPPCYFQYVEAGKVDIHHIKKLTCFENQKIIRNVDSSLNTDIDYSNDSLFNLLVYHLSKELFAMKKVQHWIATAFTEFNLPNIKLTTPELTNIIIPILKQQNQLAVIEYSHVANITCKYVKDEHERQLNIKIRNQEYMEKTFIYLQSQLLLKCPLIGKKLIPLDYKSSNPYQSTIKQFIHPKHEKCSHHRNSCLDRTISDLAAIYRSSQCKSHLIKEMGKYITNFTLDDLKIPNASQRFHDSIQLGMWMHVPKNALRIYRTEIIGRELGHHQINLNQIIESSLNTVQQYIKTEDDDPLGDLNTAVQLIVESERNRKMIVQETKQIVESYGLETSWIDKTIRPTIDNELDLSSLESIVQCWIYNHHHDIHILKSHIQFYLNDKQLNDKQKLIETKISNDPFFQGLFLNQEDRQLFLVNPQFDYILQATPIFYRYMDQSIDDHTIGVEEVVKEVVDICRQIIFHEISPKALWVIMYYTRS
ncbi:hypothetical protein BC833DRAFT_587166 [Globomyces pollinis-pini]|nr:hypothetical protein BC833DRAFT_587166 [Globomyces pollinis-pini]